MGVALVCHTPLVCLQAGQRAARGLGTPSRLCSRQRSHHDAHLDPVSIARRRITGRHRLTSNSHGGISHSGGRSSGSRPAAASSRRSVTSHRFVSDPRGAACGSCRSTAVLHGRLAAGDGRCAGRLPAGAELGDARRLMPAGCSAAVSYRHQGQAEGNISGQKLGRGNHGDHQGQCGERGGWDAGAERG